MSYYPGKGLKKIGKGMKKLNVFHGLAKSKDKDDPLKGRVYTVDKQQLSTKDGNITVGSKTNEESKNFNDLQNEYFKEKQTSMEYDKKYKSIHADKFKLSQQQRGSLNDDEFAFLSKPTGDAEKQALSMADYKTQVAVQRANANNKNTVDLSQVDKSHRSSKKIQGNQNFEQGFLDSTKPNDVFNLINANTDYFDQKVEGEQDQQNLANDFFKQQQMHFGVTESQVEDMPLRSQRSIAFNDVMLGDEFGHINDISNIRDIAPIEDNDEMGFGEVNDDGQVVTDRAFDSNDDEEEKDQVGEMEDFFNIDNKKSGGRERHTSAMAPTTELLQGLQEARNADPENLDERIRQITGGEQFGADIRQRGKRTSFILEKRKALKVRSIQKQIAEEENEGIVQEGSMAGQPRLRALQGRKTSKYDEMARNKVAESMVQEAEGLTKVQEEDLKNQKVLQAYRDLLDQDDQNEADQRIQNQDGEQLIILDQTQDLDTFFDENFLSDFYKEMNMTQVEQNLSANIQNQGKNHEVKEITKKRIKGREQFDNDFTKESQDLIRFIDWNERRHNYEAIESLKQNQNLAQQAFQCDQIKQHKITNDMPLVRINQKMNNQKLYDNSKATCIALSDDLILVGNSLGILWMYYRDNQEPHDCFMEKGKDFQANPIVAIAVHPTFTEYVILGYQFGQIVLIDVLKPVRTLKIVKDHHRGSALANLQFCEWTRSAKEQLVKAKTNETLQKNPSRTDSINENPYGNPNMSIDQSPYDQVNSSMMQSMKKESDCTSWMFISIDVTGRVLVNTIVRIGVARMSYYNATKLVLIEPNKNEAKYLSVSCRFKSDLHPQIKINDKVTLAAVGSTDHVGIFAISQTKCDLISQINRPEYKVSANGELRKLNNCLPAMEWGFGHTPVFKDKCYATLAVGWGPLIQLFVLNDVMDPDQIFYEDGYEVLQFDTHNQSSQDSSQNFSNLNNSQNQQDVGMGRNTELNQINPFEQEQRYETLAKTQNQQISSISSAFERVDLCIERIFFISESILLIMTRDLEYKMFYTQKFKHGPYDAKTYKPQMMALSPNQSVSQEVYDGVMTTVKKSVALIDDEIFVRNLAQSVYGPAYCQTLQIFDGQLLALKVEGLYVFRHIRWDESLRLYKQLTRGNWIQEFARAVDIYTGKIKGFKDVSEDQTLRQETMKGELKMQVRSIITEQLEKWGGQKKQQQKATAPEADNPYGPTEQAEDPPNLDETNMDILKDLEILDQQRTNEEIQRYRTLIRVSIEFCVTIQDCYFLFYDLFLVFQEEQLEKIFLDELKPFIMAGRFSGWELSNDILQNHIINYYKETDAPALVEKIVINLNLKECPPPVIDELILFSYRNFLATGLLYLYSSLFDTGERERSAMKSIFRDAANTDVATCLPVKLIRHLLELYRKANDANKGSVEEIASIKDMNAESNERLKIEKSAVYMGYKILWIIRLFLNGKKFPYGNIPKAQWKSYVHEIIDCVTQEEIMIDLLYIDAEAYFQIISICYYKGVVFDFLKEGKLQQEKMIKVQQEQVENAMISRDLYEDLMPYLSHNQILERFDQVCQTKAEMDHKVPDYIRLQYLFFVANVASKSNISKDRRFYLSCMKELLNQSKQFLKFNQTLMQRAMNRKNRSASVKSLDENKHLYVSENALIELLDLCEPLEDDEIEDLISKTEYTRFNHLRVKLLEKKEDYVQCLQLFVDGMKVKEYASSRESVMRVFNWIEIILAKLEAKKTDANKESSHREDLFKKQILLNFRGLINMNAEMTLDLIDVYFENQHEKFVESISGHNQDQLKYLDAMLTVQNDRIQNCIKDYCMSGTDKEKAQSYMNLQNQHLRLLCQISPDKVLDRVKKIKNNKIHFPLEDCLQICQEYKMVEACAILTNKMTNYFASVTDYYMTLLTDKTLYDYPKLIKQISKIQKDGHKTPVFIPYIDKAVRQRNKAIMKSAQQGIEVDIAEKFEEDPITIDDINRSEILRFDYILRKIVKICKSESTDNYNENTIDMIWFYSLDQMLEIQQKEVKILQSIRDQKVESYQLTAKEQQSLDSNEEQPGQILNSKKQKYSQHIKNLEEFMKSRITYVIESTLEFIELRAFLDHIVKNDENIRYKELRDMIMTIFGEVSNDCLVLHKANLGAQKQILASFQNCGADHSTGILFNYRLCNKCKRFLDEEVKQKKKKQQLISHARRGTFISQQGFSADQESDSDDYEGDGDTQQGEQNFRLYDCGHAFHVHCIKNHINEQMQKGSQFGSQHSRVAPVSITKKMLEQQKCPWCYSDRFKVDFESLFQRQTRRAAGGGNLLAAHRQSIVQNPRDALADDMDFDDDMGFEDRKMRAQRSRDVLTGTMVQRVTKSIQEQKMSQFDRICFNEGVTREDFNLFV